MKEITIEEILYEGRKYQLEKPLILKVKEIEEKQEQLPQDNEKGYYSENVGRCYGEYDPNDFGMVEYNGIYHQCYYNHLE